MENIDHFIDRRHQKEQVIYPAQALAPILSPTYGILVYQEQVMQVAAVMAGFSLGQADILRRAMSKKKLALIDQLRTKFIQGAKNRGYSTEAATKVYDYIERFANYGFNRSHAVAYTKMAFELAYLKCHFPAAFMAALLGSVIGDSDKTKEYVLEARQLKVQLHGPNLNLSRFGFSLDHQQIIFGLNSIRSLRRDFVWAILSERKRAGRFKNFQDFLQRMPEKFLKTDSLQALIYSGAGDTFGQTRATLLHNLSKILDNRLLSGNNIELLAVLAPKLEQIPEINLNERLSQEEKYLGTFISAHPVTRYSKLAAAKKTTLIVQLQSDQSVRILLYLKDIKTIRTKKGEQMAFLTGEDQTGQIEVIIFPNLYRQVATDLKSNQVYLIAGKVQERNQRRQLIAVQMKAAADVKTPMKKTFYLRLPSAFDDQRKQQLWQLMRRYQGDNPVIIYEEATAKKLALAKQYWLADSDELRQLLVKMIGKENLVVKNENE
jgi:DNA polymerase-3 subunit alpha